MTGIFQEFIIRTRRGNMADVFVSRRYGDFKTLADEVSPVPAHLNQALKSYSYERHIPTKT